MKSVNEELRMKMRRRRMISMKKMIRMKWMMMMRVTGYQALI